MLKIYLAALFLLILLWICKGRIVNLFYLAALVIDAWKDVACQAFLDLQQLWRRVQRWRDPYNSRFNGEDVPVDDFFHRDY
jgi:hypothetical protein